MTLTIAFMSAQVLLIGALLAATPWLMPPTECFSVTVPPSAQQDPRVRGYRRSYALVVGAVAVVCALGLACMLTRLLGNDPSSTENASKASVAITLATIVPLVVGMALMLWYRSRVRALKQAEGWTAPVRRTAAIVSEDLPQPISLAWNLLYVPLVLAMVCFALMSYDRFPDQIPMNVDLSGNVTNYATKSVGAVLFPAIVAGYMGLIFVVCHWLTIVSKRPVDPAAPVTSALAYGRFARIQSQMMLVGGLLITAGVGCAFYLSALGIIPLESAAVALMVLVLVVVGAVMIVSVWYGQSGSRLARELRTSDEIASDDDAHWILGSIYFNRDDPSIVVPKRFGIGWTINCASPVAWLATAMIILVTALFCLLMTTIVG